jgi:hypothetical protein
MQHDFKVGDKARVLNNSYTKTYGSVKGEVDFPGNIAYVTYAAEHGCQLAFDPNHDPYNHSYASRFFSYDEFEYVA